jgi:hypothetical protein
MDIENVYMNKYQHFMSVFMKKYSIYLKVKYVVIVCNIDNN